jgi:hypothetical protein
MLSDAVDDSTLKKTTAAQSKPVVQTTPNATQTAAVVATPQVAATIPVAVSTPAVTSNTNTAITPPAGQKGIIKSTQHSDDSGTDVTFVDFTNDVNDTIRIFIPAVQTANSDNTLGQQNATPVSANSGTISTNATPESGSANNPFYKSSTPANNVLPANVATRQDCAKMATDADLDKVRKKMIKETEASEMVIAAKRSLDGKCVTTAQIKTMGSLFTSDEARYNFYEAMYNFTYDYGNYPSLETELIDAYYKKRFNSLLR